MNILSDEELAERFKKEHSEQFQVLVRMHLSFVLDLNSEENDCINDKSKFKKWTLVPFVKKSKQKNGSDGIQLSEELISYCNELIQFLKKEENIKIEGVFRRTGSLARQHELRNLLTKGKLELEQGTFNVHDCASVLKGLLAELIEPLLTEAHFPAYCQIAELCGFIESPTQEEKLLEAIQLLMILLPADNKKLLREILDLLYFTTLYENTNRMSADNLAKLFTPHLLCPRKLSPEQLHVNSQTLCGIISFMIKHACDIFKIPHKLMIECRARYDDNKILEQKFMDESVSDQYAAKTVFTFVDHERTAKENESNPTETALAQLYAHIQSLPESSKKRKLVKQFNKENGHGTPLQFTKNNLTKNKSLGDSIKKHIFQKKLTRSIKSVTYNQKKSLEDISDSPQPNLVTRARLFCTKCDSSPEASNEPSMKKSKFTASTELGAKDSDLITSPSIKRSLSDPALSPRNSISTYLTSTPACMSLYTRPNMVFTPTCEEHTSVSPITKSTQRMSRAMQETMMTPRSRKPVLLVSGTNINTLTKMEHNSDYSMESVIEEPSSISENICMRSNSFKKSKSDGDMVVLKNKRRILENTDPSSSLTSTFREYLNSRSIIALDSPRDLSFSSRTDDYSSGDIENVNGSQMSDSLLNCLNGNDPNDDDTCDKREQKQLVLKPRQFDQNGQPIIFETSF